MKLTTKKIFAREFLTLILILVLTGLFILIIYSYNAYKQTKIDSIRETINFQNKKSDSLSNQYNEKLSAQRVFFVALTSEFSITDPEQNSSDKTWKILRDSYYSDSMAIKFEKNWDAKLVSFLKSKGYESGNTFENFVGKNILTKDDSINFQKSDKINQSISGLEKNINNYHYQIISSDEQLRLSLWVLVILLIIIYPLRFLLIGIKWSIKTIKQQD